MSDDAHTHGHGHGHSHRRVARLDEIVRDVGARRSERGRLLGAIALTATIFVVEIVGGALSGSLSLLSDAGHMLSDVGAQVLSLVALLIAERPSDRRRTYGWYRVEILAALGNGLALVALSGWIVWSAIARLGQPAHAIDTTIMVAVAAVGIAANVAGALLLRGSRSLNVRGAYLHTVQDLLSSVVVLAAGVVITVWPAAVIVDPLLSIAIGAFVLWGAWGLVRDAVDVLLEAVPSSIDPDAVTGAIAGRPGVREVHDLHLWTLTSGIYALSAHLVVAPQDEGHADAILADVGRVLLDRFHIGHTTIQVESPGYEHVGFTCAQGPVR